MDLKKFLSPAPFLKEIFEPIFRKRSLFVVSSELSDGGCKSGRLILLANRACERQVLKR